jgi:hypothetical protein
MMLPHSEQGGASACVWKITFSFDSIADARLNSSFASVFSSGFVSATTVDAGCSSFGKNFMASQRKM